MTPERRHRTITTLPSGAQLDESAYRWMLSEWDARAPKRAVVKRLSESMPDLQMTGRLVA